ncbi:MAG TPA: hypothetical protein VF981_11855 [Gemmatimonadaceae bacterium]
MRRLLAFGLGLAACGALVQIAGAQEDITVTSYYPSPRGVYQELRSINDAYLAYDPADLTSMVAIGTTQPPVTSTAKLYVLGPIDADAFRAFQQNGIYAFLESGATDATLPNGALVGAYNSATNSFAPLKIDGAPVLINSRVPAGPGQWVGIGTTQPRRSLEVNGTIVANQKIVLPTCSAGNFSCLIWNLDAGVGLGNRFRVYTQPDFNTPGEELMTITTNGNMGIKTTNPLDDLQIESTDPSFSLSRPGVGRIFRIRNNPTRSEVLFDFSPALAGDGGGGTDTAFMFVNPFRWENPNVSWPTPFGLNGNVHTFFHTNPGTGDVHIRGGVGINTDQPMRHLHVNGEIVAVNRMSLATDMTLTSPTWHMDNFADRFRIFRQPNLNTAGTEYFTIDSTGGEVRSRGNFRITGTYICSSAWDIAETVATVEGLARPLEPGDVVVIAKEADEQVTLTSQPYDPLVAGVVSTNPGVLLGGELDGSAVAIMGRVPLKVTAENGPIRRGDLLVSASKPGYAMRGDPDAIEPGTLIGKAMGEHESGDGTVTVFLTLR